MASIACSAAVFSVISGRDGPVDSRHVLMCRPVGAPGWHECKAHVGSWPWPGGSTETRGPPFPDAPRPGPWRCRGPVARRPYRAIAADGMGKNCMSCVYSACILPPPACRRRWRWRPLRPVESHAVTGAYGGRTPEKTIKRAFSAHSIGRGLLLAVAVPAL